MVFMSFSNSYTYLIVIVKCKNKYFLRKSFLLINMGFLLHIKIENSVKTQLTKIVSISTKKYFTELLILLIQNFKGIYHYLKANI